MLELHARGCELEKVIHLNAGKCAFRWIDPASSDTLKVVRRIVGRPCLPRRNCAKVGETAPNQTGVRCGGRPTIALSNFMES
jgi:hypothetical protein